MKATRWMMSAVILLLLSTAGNLFSVEFDTHGATAGKWTMDFNEAKKLAAEKQLPILLDFSGSDWCGWCKIMEESVFTKPEWREYAKDQLVMVLIDFPKDKSLVPEKYVERNNALKSKYGVSGYPTFVVLDNDGKTELGRLRSGRAKTPESFQAELRNLLRFRSVEVEKFIARLGPDDQTTYRKLIKKQVADKQALARETKAYSETRNNMRKLENSIQETDEQMIQLRVAQLDESGQKQFEELGKKLEEAKTQLSDWFKTKPEQNEENKAKYQEMQTAIKEIENKIGQY